MTRLPRNHTFVPFCQRGARRLRFWNCYWTLVEWHCFLLICLSTSGHWCCKLFFFWERNLKPVSFVYIKSYRSCSTIVVVCTSGKAISFAVFGMRVFPCPCQFIQPHDPTADGSLVSSREYLMVWLLILGVKSWGGGTTWMSWWKSRLQTFLFWGRLTPSAWDSKTCHRNVKNFLTILTQFLKETLW